MRTNNRRSTSGCIASAVVTVALVAGCGSGAAGGGSAIVVPANGAQSTFSGDVLSTAVTLPAVTLTDQQGQPFSLRERTRGKFVLVYVGYTHCPDVCPTTMADIAVAMRRLTPAQRGRIDVVFISSDPTRDTPSRLKSWLSYFDGSFIGLTGAYATIGRAAHEMGIPIEPPVKQADGSITVTHGAEVLAFTPDQRSKLVYTAGFGPIGLADDVVRLEKGVQP